MNKLHISEVINTVRSTVMKRSPEILTGIGIAGMFTATVLAVKETPKAIRLIEERKSELQVEKLPGVEVVKTAWKPYIPAAVMSVAFIACLVGASSVNLRRNAALATAYNLSKTALTEYQTKTIETIGEKKEQIIRDKVAEEQLKKNPVSNNEVFMTARGNTLCCDTLSRRYFMSEMDLIKKAENELNKRMISDMYVSLNDFYDILGLECTTLGDELGWKLDDGMVDLQFSSQIADDGRPCLVINYNISPKYNYDSFL